MAGVGAIVDTDGIITAETLRTRRGGDFQYERG